ncbi:MAG: TolC family protein [Phycisphaeraceae bacterium]|nr:TolC family protein [Phycisphaeraceae bacterium]
MLLLVGGCRGYEAAPLDLSAHRDAWRARTPSDDPVVEFARRLARSGEPGVFDLTDGLSLAEGEIVSLVFNPDLRLARLRAGVAAATAEHAGLWDDPQIGVDFLSLTESAPNPLVVTPGLSFTIPISGRLEAEKARADAALAAELTRVAEREWQTRVEVRKAWLRWSAALLRAEQTERLLASIESLVGSTARLAEAGEIVRTEAALFIIEQGSQRQSLLRARGEAAEAEQTLRSLMGLAPDAPLELVPTVVLQAAPEDMTPDAIAERNLTLVRLREEYEIAEQTLRREVRRQYPDLTIGPLAEFDRGDTLLGFSLALPIPILNANKQGIAEAHAERDLARAGFETAYERLTGSVAATRARLANFREQLEFIETDMAPMVDRQLTDARSLLQLGESGTLVLLESLTRVAQTRMAVIDARLGESLAIAELALLVGPPTTPTVQPSNPQLPNATEIAPLTHEGDAAREVNP